MENYLIPLNNDTTRKIIHIDMDAFFASVEERDNPKLKGRPLVIARHPKETKGKGVVTTANYEARKYGIHSAMSAKEAYERCPEAVFVPGRMEHYKGVSRQIHQIFAKYTELIEPMSLDEAYLDVTENKVESKSAMKIASLIQRDIWNELKLTSSAGISYNKFLAKIASDYKKPAGQTVILPKDAQAFLKKLPIKDFQGVGIKTLEKMDALGIKNGEDLLAFSEMDLIYYFGKMGYYLFRKVRGVDLAAVNPNRERKSVGREKTFSEILVEEEKVSIHLRELSNDVSDRLKKLEKHGNVLTVKIRTADFKTKTKQMKLENYTSDSNILFNYAQQLIFVLLEESDKINLRLLGISISQLVPDYYEHISLDI